VPRGAHYDYLRALSCTMTAGTLPGFVRSRMRQS
jgi:hypothetical protein